MSSSVVAESCEAHKPADSTVVIIVNNDGSIQMDEQTLQKLLAANQQSSMVSVVRMAEDGSPQSTNEEPRAEVTVESGFFTPPVTPADPVVTEALVDPFLEMDPEQLERLETALQSEQAKQILGEGVTAMLDMLTSEEDQTMLKDSIRMDHCYTSCGAGPSGASRSTEEEEEPSESEDEQESDEEEPWRRGMRTTRGRANARGNRVAVPRGKARVRGGAKRSVPILQGKTAPTQPLPALQVEEQPQPQPQPPKNKRKQTLGTPKPAARRATVDSVKPELKTPTPEPVVTEEAPKKPLQIEATQVSPPDSAASRKLYPKRENRKPPAHLTEAFGPALFSTPDIPRRISDAKPPDMKAEESTIEPTGAVVETPEAPEAPQELPKVAPVVPQEAPPVVLQEAQQDEEASKEETPEELPKELKAEEAIEEEPPEPDSKEMLVAELQAVLGELHTTQKEELEAEVKVEVPIKTEAPASKSKPAAKRRGSATKVTAAEVTEMLGSLPEPHKVSGKRRSATSKVTAAAIRELQAPSDESDRDEDEESWNSEDDPDRLWCICKKPHNNRFMICCDRCEDWFHGHCVGVTKALGKQMEERGEEWTCPPCTKLRQEEQQLERARGQAESRSKGAGASKVRRSSDAVSSAVLEQPAKRRKSVSENKAKNDGIMCIVCKKGEARSASIYCSDACILQHAQDSITLLGKVKQQAAATKAASGKVASSSPVIAGKEEKHPPPDGKVIVFERKTGTLLAGINAPTISNLQLWLQQHPTFEVVRPGLLATLRSQKAAKSETGTVAKQATAKSVPPVAGKSSPSVAGKSVPVATVSGKTVQAVTVSGKSVPSIAGKSVPTATVVAKNVQAVAGKNVQSVTGKSVPAVTSKNVASVTVVGKSVPAATVAGKSVTGNKNVVVGSNKSSPLKSPNAPKTALLVPAQRLPVLLSKPAGKTAAPGAKLAPDSPTKTPKASPLAAKSVAAPKPVAASKPSTPTAPPKAASTTVKTTPKQATPSAGQSAPRKQSLPGPEPIRINVRKTLKEILQARIQECKDLKVSENEVTGMATSIEEELFSHFKDTGSKYKSKYRSLLFNMKDPKNLLFRKIVDGEVTPHRLVRLSAEELATTELAQWREREAQHTLEMIKKNEMELMSQAITYVMKTHKGEQVIETDDSLKLQASAVEAEPAVGESVSSTVEEVLTEKKPSEVKKEHHRREKGSSSSSSSRHRDDRKHRHKSSHSKDSKSSRRHSRHSSESRSSSSKRHRRDSAETEKTSSRSSSAQGAEQRPKSKAPTSTSSPVAVPEVDLPPETPPIQEVAVSEEVAPVLVEDLSDREPSSTVTIKTPDSNMDEPPSVWKGIINMLDVAKFFVTAQEVSGTASGLQLELVDTTLDVVGRISPDTVWDYISKMKKTGTKEIVVIRLSPANPEEKLAYVSFYSYLSTRNRFGVVGNKCATVKDFYIMPLSSHSPVPQVLLPLDGPGFEEARPHLLLGIIVRTRRKRTAEVAGLSSSNVKHKETRLGERSYTPPLPEHPGGSYTPPPGGSYTPPPRGSYTPPPGGSYTPPPGGTYTPPLPPTSLDELPYSPGGASPPVEFSSKLEELNRRIEEQKLQIESISSELICGNSQGAEVQTFSPASSSPEDEAYSPSRSFTPPPGDSATFSLPDTSSINLPSNLQEILASIQRKAEAPPSTIDPIVRDYASAEPTTPPLEEAPRSRDPRRMPEAKSSLSKLSEEELIAKANEMLEVVEMPPIPGVGPGPLFFPPPPLPPPLVLPPPPADPTASPPRPMGEWLSATTDESPRKGISFRVGKRPPQARWSRSNSSGSRDGSD